MSGWRDVLSELAATRHRSLVAYGYLLTTERAAAEDLVHDALVKVFARPRRITDVAAADRYVRRTMASLFIDRARRSAQWRKVRGLVVDDEPARGPEAAAIASTDVTAALRLLPPRERTCVVLRHLEDLSTREVAERTGLAQGSVKRYLADGMAKLGLDLTEVDERVPVEAPRAGRR